MASVKLILRKDKKDSKGEAPIYLRLIKDRKTKFISLGFRIPVKDWDEIKQQVKKRYRNSTRLNALLAKKVSDARGEVADLERSNKPTTAKRLKEAIKGKPVINFFEYAYDRLEHKKSTISHSTYINYKANIEKLEKFNGSKDLIFEDITVNTLKRFADYCSTTLGNNNTTIHYTLTILAVVFKDAIREDLIPSSMYPFSKFRVKKVKSKKTYLTEEQFQRFVDFEVSKNGKAQIIKDMFIFAVYSGGLRFGDVIELKWSNFNDVDNKITKVIGKTKQQHSFKIGKVAVKILDKYKTKDAKHDDLIFPFADIDDRYFKEPEYRRLIKKRANSLSSLHLNKIGKMLDFPFPLSFHISRHTFATRALNNGMRIEHVSKLMGHSNISVTQVYAKIVSEELDNAVDKYIN